MAARPPQDDPAEPDTITFGIAALDGHLADAEITYPADAATVVETLDDPEIPYDPSGQSMSLSTALDEVDQDRFEDENRLLDALHPVFEERRQTASTGLLARLRALF